MRAPAVCSTPGCDNTTRRGKCDICSKKARRRREIGRPTRTQRGYDRKWLRTQGAFLRIHPTCECDECMALPVFQRPASEEAHHKDGRGPTGPNGHKWSNLRALTKGHHSKVTAQLQPAGWHRH